jgi:hypothetical protein
MEGYIFYNIMINLLPQCIRCSSSVTDSIESEIEQHGKIKTGNYINGEWICDDCLGAEKKGEEGDFRSIGLIAKRKQLGEK